jgi:hypothetical protein
MYVENVDTVYRVYRVYRVYLVSLVSLVSLVQGSRFYVLCLRLKAQSLQIPPLSSPAFTGESRRFFPFEIRYSLIDIRYSLSLSSPHMGGNNQGEGSKFYPLRIP